MAHRPFEYFHDGVKLIGDLAWNDTRRDLRPGILVVHEGGGINDHPRARARALADLGYVALAADMYGNGEFTSDPKRRGELMNPMRESASFCRDRARAGLSALAGAPGVDPQRLAAIGFCFGGMVVLELARSGAALSGVVSFHGLLSTKEPAERGRVKAKVLACHGAEDPFVPPAQVEAFAEEMKNADVDWQLLVHGHASHGFTRADAASLGIPGVAFHADAERRSWRAMRDFFDELFAPDC
jgi:dienelactone hydrolase